MIQFNLLPDVKLEYIKTQRTKRAVVLISSAVAATSLGIMVLLFLGVMVFQRQHLKDLTTDINQDKQKLSSIQDLNKILTVQNQLNTLTGLHEQKPVSSRLIGDAQHVGYMQQITPAGVSVASMSIDYTANTMTLTGSASSLALVNQFVDTLKFTTYDTGEGSTSANAFSKVVLGSFGKDDKGASYSISLTFDHNLFDATKNVKLTVPKTVTTRSQTEQPGALFQPLSNTTGGTQ